MRFVRPATSRRPSLLRKRLSDSRSRKGIGRRSGQSKLFSRPIADAVKGAIALAVGPPARSGTGRRHRRPLLVLVYLLDRREGVLDQVVRDLQPDDRALNVGRPEMDAAADPGAEDFLERVRETSEGTRRVRVVAEGVEGDLVGAEEGLERV